METRKVPIGEDVRCTWAKSERRRFCRWTFAPEESLDGYYVGDITPEGPAAADKVKLILLFESPSSDELVHMHPLAGRSGKRVACVLRRVKSYFGMLDPEVPLGCQLKPENYPRVAVLNCSNYPLVKSAYCARDYESAKDRIDACHSLRQSRFRHIGRDSYQDAIGSALVLCLQNRLRPFAGAVIVPCGVIARTVLGHCHIEGIKMYNEVNVPHPSYGHWDRPSNEDIMVQFLRDVERILGD